MNQQLSIIDILHSNLNIRNNDNKDSDHMRFLRDNIQDHIEYFKKHKLPYQFDSLIRSGSWGLVYKALSIHNNTYVAIKCVPKLRNKTKNNLILNEIEILRKLKNHPHPNILEFIESYESDDFYYIITCFYEAYDLFDFVTYLKKLSEKDAAKIMIDITKGIEHLHKLNIIHRDLKIDNLLITKTSQYDQIKDPFGYKVIIIDFGFARELRNEEYIIDEYCGTIEYAAPELITRDQYSYEIEYWALGVILFILLCGYPPFPYRNIRISITNKNYNIFHHKSSWTNQSEYCKDLIKCLLNHDVKTRYKYENIYKHPWISNF